MTRKPTLADVAARAGVSAMTVSRVVNGHPGVGAETRRIVSAAVRELGYRPNIVARGLKARESRMVGLLVPDITNPYFPAIVRGAEDVALAAGYTVLLNNAVEDTDREARALLAFEDRRVDGVIACSPRLEEGDLHRLLQRHAAAVVVNRRAPANVAGSARIDNELGAQLAIRHLLEIGCTRPGVLAGPPGSHAERERRQGLMMELAAHGMDLDERLFVHASPTVEGGQDAAAHLLAAVPDVDGMMCFNDLVAAGALRTLARRGIRVPADVAVIGYDDIPFARMFTPPLTTIHVPTYEMGVHAMEMLLARMEGRHRTVGIVLQPELVVRASTVGREEGTPDES